MNKIKNIKRSCICLVSIFSLVALLNFVDEGSNYNVNADETVATEVNNENENNEIVKKIKPKKVIFTRKHKEVPCGKQRVFRVNLKGAKWKVSDKKIAKIKRVGKRKIIFIGKRYGKVTLTVRAKGKKISMKVKILPKAIVGIDAGHQKYANYELEPIGPGSSQKKIKVAGGTRGVSTGKSEGTLNLEIALKLKDKLIDKGYKVVMVREKADVNISNSERAKKLNKKCDISIRIHADGSENSSINGVSLLYPPSSIWQSRRAFAAGCRHPSIAYTCRIACRPRLHRNRDRTWRVGGNSCGRLHPEPLSAQSQSPATDDNRR